MKVLITGGRGALGTHLARELAKSGWGVVALGRVTLDVTNPDAFAAAVDECAPDVVVNCAAWTDVAAAERHGALLDGPVGAVNSRAPGELAQASASRRIAFLHVSSDYVVEGMAPPAYPAPVVTVPPGVYAVTKARGENALLAEAWGVHGAGLAVARVSTLDPAKVASYRWLNGYTRASREWVEDAARRLVAFLAAWRPFRIGEPRIWHLAPPGRDTTVAELVRARFPDHPALADVVTSPEEFARRTGYHAPLDVRLGGCPALLPGEVAS